MKKFQFFALFLASLFFITSCGQKTEVQISPSPSEPPPSKSIDSNALNLDDATWLNLMAANNQQTIEICDLAQEITKNQELKDLAIKIRGARSDELEAINDVFNKGGYSEPLDVSVRLASMPGVLTDEQMTSLSQLTGADFDKAYLSAMIAHHEGVVDEAGNMLVSGSNEKVKEMAQNIISTFNEEIVLLKVLLGGL